MMLLQGREGDSPAADQVPGRQAWAGGRIRGTVCQFIPFLEALLTIRVCYFFLLACVDDLVSMHLYFSPLFFSLGAFFLCFIPLLFFPFFLLHTSSCMLPCFPNIGDERNSRARKGNRCTIQMWDYTHIHPGLYIASVYIYIIYMLTSACGLLINLKKIVRVTTCLASELVRSCSCCR